MEIAGYVVIAIALSVTAFSVALNTSIFRCLKGGESILIALTFGVFHVLMFSIGWLIGHSMQNLLSELSWPIGIFLFILIGARMIIDYKKVQSDRRTIAVKDARLILGFGLVTATNAFIVGIGMGFMIANVFIMAVTLFIAAMVLVFLGIWLGKKGLMNIWKPLELSGGIILILAGLFFVILLIKMH